VSHFSDGVQIHGYARAFNEMLLPVQVLQNRRQLSLSNGLVFELQGQVWQRFSGVP
jgi:hypothetical protein